MARSWAEYLDEFSTYLDALRRDPAVGISPASQAPERPVGPVPDECVDRVARLHLECEELVVKMTEHRDELARRVAPLPLSPHGSRAATYIETNI